MPARDPLSIRLLAERRRRPRTRHDFARRDLAQSPAATLEDGNACEPLRQMAEARRGILK